MDTNAEVLDIVDAALDVALDEFIPDDLDIDEADMRCDLFQALIADLIDDGVIQEVPFPEESDEVKQQWIDASLPVLKDKFREELDGDISLG